MVYYPLSLHLQQAFAHLGHKAGDFPESEAAQNEVLSLPVFPELTDKELETVCASIKEYYAK
jgi:UDP-2-acetamido-2-deoxy-ribo-hexuluronate aminotransferase